MKETEVRALFLLADIPVNSIHKIENEYWPDHPDYNQVKKDNPWWIVITNGSVIKIGWRKRVINIDWTNAPWRFEITKDDVTKESNYVHAWSFVKALEYLTNLSREMKKK